MFEFPADFVWLYPWIPLEDDYEVLNMETLGSNDSFDTANANLTASEIVVRELHREMPTSHKLFGLKLKAVAVCTITHKDFLLVTDDSEKPIAYAHPTWKVETDPSWPMAKTFRTLEEWENEMAMEYQRNRPD